MIGYKEIKRYDEGLCDVKLVESPNGLKIMKAPALDPEDFYQSLNHVKRDARNLKKVADLEVVVGFEKYFPNKALSKRHPAIATMQKYGMEISEYPVLIREFIPGRTLMDGEKIQNVHLQNYLKRGVEMIHNRGLVSLDIKADNILLASYGLPILPDLSSADHVEDDNLSRGEFNFRRELDIKSLESLFY